VKERGIICKEKTMKVKISLNCCSLHVEGIDMNCPVCGTIVKSRQTHSCASTSNAPKSLQKAVKRPLNSRGSHAK